ncbi:MAG TPA: histidinol-phosphate transaminase [Candidatus Limnocylindria bacterium]|nr:histidinol-phosphate transaminase [Candidatus Limnocylindria bacterium]
MSRSTGQPADLLRLRDTVEPYPAEPSDEQLAEELGLPPERVIRFDMNTLGGGPLPAVVEALRTYDPARLVEYGDQAYRALRAAIEAATGAPPQRIIPGAGADELIRLVTSMTVGAGHAVVIPTPTFAMFGVEARLAGARVVEVPRRAPTERQPVELIRAAAETAAARLVWLCSPNNPTGDMYEHDEIERLASGLEALVVVDAVYQELAEVEVNALPEAFSLLPLQERLPNLVILRSLSKAYGLAGARVGYLVVPDGLAARFEASRLPLAIGGASEAAAIAALSDVRTARVRLAEIVNERERVMAALLRLGWDVYESHANFLLVHPADAHAIAADLLRQGMAVRNYPAGLLRDWLRITIRARAENDRLLAALGAIG